MCGFFAIYSDRGLKQYQKSFSKMNSLIRHRGPDDEGFACFGLRNNKYVPCYGEETPAQVKSSNYLYSPRNHIDSLNESSFDIAFGHRRLSIIDLSPAGHQPMSSADGKYWIVYNGEVYNFKEIRKLLVDKGVQFQSNTDTEVVLQSYIQWGERCLEMFNGMWAFCILDIERKELFVSRDRFGIKPLFCYHANGLLSFFSEVKVLKPLNVLEPNYREMIAYLCDGMSETNPETFYKDVYRFPAGSYSFIDLNNTKGGIRTYKYWEHKHLEGEDAKFDKVQLKKYCDKYIEILSDAVSCRLIADVPIGFCLSGGLDSSSVIYLANKMEKKRDVNFILYAISNIYTNEDEKYCDESKYINEMLKVINAKSIAEAPKRDMILQLNDLGLWCAENSFDKLAIPPLNTFSMFKKNGLKVALDGQGADEQLGGYERYWRNYFSTRNKSSLDYWYSLFSKSNMSLKDKIRFALNFKSLQNATRHNFNFINTELDDLEYRMARAQSLQGRYDNNVIISEALSKSLNNNLKKLLRVVDFSSMAFSVEARQPFLDFRLVEFLNEIPAIYKIRMSWTKYMARKAFDGLLPDIITWRKDKMGFSRPLREWVKGDIRHEMRYDIINNNLLDGVIVKDELSNDKLEKIFDSNIGLAIRLYNLSHTLNMFFGK